MGWLCLAYKVAMIPTVFSTAILVEASDLLAQLSQLLFSQNVFQALARFGDAMVLLGGC